MLLNSPFFSSHVKFSPNSRFVLASTQDSTIRLWNYQTSKCVKTYTGHSNRTYCIPACFITSKGKYIVSGSEDNKIYIWDLQTRQVLQVLDGHRGNYNFISPRILLTYYEDAVLAIAVSLLFLQPIASHFTSRRTLSAISSRRLPWKRI